MSDRSQTTETELLKEARAGSGTAFDRLVAPHRSALRSFAHRLVLHPDDAEDVTQATLLQAFEKLSSFRGDAAFRTWLFSIQTRKCVDHLRARRRWPVEAQQTAARRHEQSLQLLNDIRDTATTRYDYREHVAYCFSCVGRSLAPEESAALLLREVFELTNAEAATALNLSESTLRHRLTTARKHMAAAFDGLCALVGKQGVCWQCRGLRDVVVPRDLQGDPVRNIAADDATSHDKLHRRLAIVRESRFASVDAHSPLHEYLVRYMCDVFG